MTLCYDERFGPEFVEEYGLPLLTENHIREVMATVFAAEGFALDFVGALSSEEMRKGISEWGKRTAYARERTAWRVMMVREC